MSGQRTRAAVSRSIARVIVALVMVGQAAAVAPAEAQGSDVAFSIATYLCPEIESIDAGECVEPIEGLQVWLPGGAVLTTGADGTANGVATPDEAGTVSATVRGLFVELIVCHADGVYQTTRSEWGPAEEEPRTDFSVDTGGNPAILCSMYFVNALRSGASDELVVLQATVWVCAGMVELDERDCSDPSAGRDLAFIGGDGNLVEAKTDANGWARGTVIRGFNAVIQLPGFGGRAKSDCVSGTEEVQSYTLPVTTINLLNGRVTALRCDVYVVDGPIPGSGLTADHADVSVSILLCRDQATAEAASCFLPGSGLRIRNDESDFAMTDAAGFARIPARVRDRDGTDWFTIAFDIWMVGAAECRIGDERIKTEIGEDTGTYVPVSAWVGGERVVNCVVYLIAPGRARAAAPAS